MKATWYHSPALSALIHWASMLDYLNTGNSKASQYIQIYDFIHISVIKF